MSRVDDVNRAIALLHKRQDEGTVGALASLIAEVRAETVVETCEALARETERWAGEPATARGIASIVLEKLAAKFREIGASVRA